MVALQKECEGFSDMSSFEGHQCSAGVIQDQDIDTIIKDVLDTKDEE